MTLTEINYTKIFDKCLYNSYGYEIESYFNFVQFIKYSESAIRDEYGNTSDTFMDDIISYLNYRLHTEGIMKYKEPTEKRIEELNTLLNTYKEDHEYYGTAIGSEIEINILKPIEPEEVIDKLNEKIQFYQFILDLLEKNKLIYNL